MDIENERDKVIKVFEKSRGIMLIMNNHKVLDATNSDVLAWIYPDKNKPVGNEQEVLMRYEEFLEKFPEQRFFFYRFP